LERALVVLSEVPMKFQFVSTLLKHGTDKLIKMLTWVINRCLNGEKALQQRKVAYISSIHKKGSKKDHSNYRQFQ